MLGMGTIQRMNVIVTATDAASAKIQGITGKLRMLGTVAAGAAVTGLLYFGKRSLDTFLSFDKQMVDSLAMFSDVTDEMERKMRNAARKIGRELPFVSAEEAAQGLWYLGSAGLSAADSLSIIGDVAKFSMANVVDMATGANIAATTMKTFGMTAADVPSILNMMTVAQKNALTTMQEMGEAFSYTAGLAAQLGVPIADLLTAIDMLADANIKGSMAGTALRRIMANIIAPTGRAKEAIEELGLSFFDAQGNFIGLQESLFLIMKTLAPLTEEQQANYMEALAGTRAISGLAAIVKKGEGAYRELYDAISENNDALDTMATEKIKSAAGQIDILKSKIHDWSISAGEDIAAVVLAFDNLVAQLKDPTKRDLSDALEAFGILFNNFAVGIGTLLPKLNWKNMFNKEGLVVAANAVLQWFANNFVNPLIDAINLTFWPLTKTKLGKQALGALGWTEIKHWKPPQLEVPTYTPPSVNIPIGGTPPGGSTYVSVQNLYVNDGTDLINQINSYGAGAGGG